MTPSDLELATLGGGCFWCVEAALGRIQGVETVTSGYAGGHDEQPTYQAVCSGKTGHAEVVQVTFDPDVLSFRELLEVFFSIHDPTTPNRQGADVGSQYRSIILTHDDEQARVAEALIQELEGQGIWQGIVTEVEPLDIFHKAEAHHQDYYENNPAQGYCRAVIEPKLKKLRDRWSDKLVESA